MPHTDLIMCPREALSPLGKRGNPRGGEGHCRVKRASEKLKRRTVFEGFVLLFPLEQQRETHTDRKRERGKAHSFVSVPNGCVWTSSGCCNKLFSPLLLRTLNTDEEWGKRTGKEKLEEVRIEKMHNSVKRRKKTR